MPDANDVSGQDFMDRYGDHDLATEEYGPGPGAFWVTTVMLFAAYLVGVVWAGCQTW